MKPHWLQPDVTYGRRRAQRHPVPRDKSNLGGLSGRARTWTAVNGQLLAEGYRIVC